MHSIYNIYIIYICQFVVKNILYQYITKNYNFKLSTIYQQLIHRVINNTV